MGNSAGKIADKIEDLDFDEESDDEIEDLVDAIEDEDALTVLLKPKICDTCPDCPDCPDCSLKLGGNSASQLRSLMLTDLSTMSRCDAAVNLAKMNIYEAVVKVNAATAAAAADTAPTEIDLKKSLETVVLVPGANTMSTKVVTALFKESVIVRDTTTGVLTFKSDTFDTLINCGAADDDEGYRLKYGAVVDSETKRHRFIMGCDIAIVILLLLILWLVKTRKR